MEPKKYEELVASADAYDVRLKALTDEMDRIQSSGIDTYAASQENALGQAKAASDRYNEEFVATAKEALATADAKTSIRLMEAYGAYGVREE